MSQIFMTDKGKVRQHNEDSGAIIRNKSGQRLAIVADGMGGHRAGDVASSLTVEKLTELWTMVEEIKTADEAENWLESNILEVNQYVFDYASTHPECEGMGTTIIGVISTENFSTIAHVGDSRCYLYNEDGFKQITEDHSLVNELVRMGQISKEDAEHHPRKNVVLRALGTDAQLNIDVMTIMFEEGDIIFICSDGLSNKVTDQQIKEILEKEITLEEKASTLIETANINGGEDNITVVILEYGDGHQAGEGQ
ncbi:protein phosphatase [Niallia circulans]|nr:Stp1/IreP family PP2C-type Ser/Thr phosphatase [Niallia circulans]PAD27244.1 protein phosphatase [Niallia circulans]PAD89600.1 protein phosphatase [Niallia circulans]PAE14279.1 protein phosphatase [Niallia circulans]